MPARSFPPDEILDRAIAAHALPGALASTVAGDEIACASAGFADAAAGRPADVGLIARWYSITKPLTAIVVGEAAAAGRIDLDAPVAGAVPGLDFADPLSRTAASLRDCLLHRTGLEAGDWTWDGVDGDLVARVVHLPCRRGYGQGFHYQNLHLAIIQRALAEAGIDWHAAVRDVLAPLGIAVTTRDAELAGRPRMLPHGPNGLGPAQPIAETRIDGIAAGGGIAGSIEALARVAGMAAGRGAWAGRRVIPAERFAMLTAPAVRQADGPYAERTAAWTAIAGRWTLYRGYRLLAFAGGYRGATSHLIAAPDRGVAACALVNRSASPASEAICLESIDRLLGLDPLPWVARFAEEKRRLRERGAARLAERLARPPSRWPAPPPTGVFAHPAYGDLIVERDGADAWMRFRDVRLPLRPMPDGMVAADGLRDGSEIMWDLRCADGGWLFNPDAADVPLAFRRRD